MDSVQAATNPRGLCWVCGAHPALAASEGSHRGLLWPRSAQTFLCCVTRSSSIQERLNFREEISHLVRHAWWAQVCSSLLLLCSLTTVSAAATARGKVTRFCGFQILRVSSNFPPSKGEDWKLVRSGHSACFYIQPSYTPVHSRGGCLGLPPPRCLSLVCAVVCRRSSKGGLGWGSSGLLCRANFKCEH